MSWRRRLADAMRQVSRQVAGPSPVDPEDVLLDAHTVHERIGIGYELHVVDLRRTGGHAPHDRTVVFLCADGRESLAAALDARRLGHGDAWAIEGGARVWDRLEASE